VNRYTAWVPEPPGDIDELIRRTFPTLRACYAHRLALEAKIKRTPSALTGEERARAILNAFSLWAAEVQEAVTGETKLDGRCGLGCLGTVVWFAPSR
jgi:hypothetical protein